MQFGERLSGDKVLINTKGYSTRGNVYEVVGDVKDIDESKFNEKNFNRLVKSVLVRTGGKIRYVGVEGDKARVQVEGSPFWWEEFIPVLEEFMPLIGVVMSVTAVTLIVKEAPVWQVVMLMIGVGLLVWSYKQDEEVRKVAREIGKEVGKWL